MADGIAGQPGLGVGVLVGVGVGGGVAVTTGVGVAVGVGVTPAPGFDEVLLPGEPERRARDRRGAEGVPIDEKSLADILAAVASLGVGEAELDRALGR